MVGGGPVLAGGQGEGGGEQEEESCQHPGPGQTELI